MNMKVKKNFARKVENFSETYLAHHPVDESYENHVFKIGHLYLCVGCTGLYSGVTIFFILFFLVPDVFQGKAIITAMISLFGTTLALFQLWLEPENKWIKFSLRFCLGLSVGAYFGLIILVPEWWWKFGLFFFLFPITFLYSYLRRMIN
ncbi:MAG: hypothetical protein ACTSX6_01945 [Candidatus Heimdallarchaeaceae archaeon]